MSNLPNPWFADPMPSIGGAAVAFAPSVAPPSDAAAEPIPEPSMTMEVSQGASAEVEPAAAGATDLIAEIFVGALKLGRDIPLDELIDCGFDVHGFMDEVEPMPLFLQARRA